MAVAEIGRTIVMVAVVENGKEEVEEEEDGRMMIVERVVEVTMDPLEARGS
ncbi:hypothetical protein Pmar_PMAR022814, partial [Perkinsus marinus ATCC 50983]